MVGPIRRIGPLTPTYVASILLIGVLVAGAIVLLRPSPELPAGTPVGTSLSADDRATRPLKPESSQRATGSSPSAGQGSARSPSDRTGPALVGRQAEGATSVLAPKVGAASLPYDPTAWKDPPPPPEYSGGALAWHLRSNPPSAEIAGYLANISRFPSGELQVLLRHLHMHPRPEMVKPLLSVRAMVPRTTFVIGAYTCALSSTALARHPHGTRAAPEAAEEAKEACLAALAMHRELVVATGRDTDSGSWSAITRHLRENWALAVPGFLSLPEAQDDLETIRTVLEAQLETAWAPGGSYAGEDDAVLLAQRIGDAETVDTLLGILDHWDVARTRFGAAFPSRNDVSALSIIGQIVGMRGSAAQVSAWVWWLIDRKERGDPDARENTLLHGYAHSFMDDERLPEHARARLREAFGLKAPYEVGDR